MSKSIDFTGFKALQNIEEKTHWPRTTILLTRHDFHCYLEDFNQEKSQTNVRF